MTIIYQTGMKVTSKALLLRLINNQAQEEGDNIQFSGSFPHNLFECLSSLILVQWYNRQVSHVLGAAESLDLEFVFNFEEPSAVPVPRPSPQGKRAEETMRVPRDG